MARTASTRNGAQSKRPPSSKPCQTTTIRSPARSSKLSAAPFLDLPPELRFQIYELALPSPPGEVEIVETMHARHRKTLKALQAMPSGQFALGKTCKALRREFMAFYYSTTTFAFGQHRTERWRPVHSEDRCINRTTPLEVLERFQRQIKFPLHHVVIRGNTNDHYPTINLERMKFSAFLDRVRHHVAHRSKLLRTVVIQAPLLDQHIAKVDITALERSFGEVIRNLQHVVHFPTNEWTAQEAEDLIEIFEHYKEKYEGL